MLRTIVNTCCAQRVTQMELLEVVKFSDVLVSTEFASFASATWRQNFKAVSWLKNLYNISSYVLFYACFYISKGKFFLSLFLSYLLKRFPGVGRPCGCHDVLITTYSVFSKICAGGGIWPVLVCCDSTTRYYQLFFLIFLFYLIKLD